MLIIFTVIRMLFTIVSVQEVNQDTVKKKSIMYN